MRSNDVALESAFGMAEVLAEKNDEHRLSSSSLVIYDRFMDKSEGRMNFNGSLTRRNNKSAGREKRG